MLSLLLNEETRQSARTFGRVLSYPLYDGNCSARARELLGLGDIDGALAEWRRLADLGSPRARCVLACVHAAGAPSIEPNLATARELAASAVAGDRGYASYLLALLALKERNAGGIFRPLAESCRARFAPAYTLLAQLLLIGAAAVPERRRQAAALLRRASRLGHVPARIVWCRAALAGHFGLVNRLAGLLLVLPVLAQMVWATRVHCFSLESFYLLPNPPQRLLRDPRAQQTAPVSKPIATVVLAMHALCALVAALVLITRPGFASPSRSPIALLGWSAVCAVPYTLSYLVVRRAVQEPVGALLQALLMAYVTLALVAHFLGAFVPMTRRPDAIALLGLVGATYLLFVAAGAARTLSIELTQTIEPWQRRWRTRMTIVHLALMGAAGGALFAHMPLPHTAVGLIEMLLCLGVALVPYVLSLGLSATIMTRTTWRPWLHVAVLTLGTFLATPFLSGLWVPSAGPSVVLYIAPLQAFVFALFSGWALEEDEERW